MAKLSLIADPTFTVKVRIPVAGGEPSDVEMTFKHRTKSALELFIKSRAGRSDVESFLEMVSGWEFEEELNPASVELLLQNYMGTALATYRTYVDELVQAKLKN
ncbi:phage tail assembly chaperone [Glaciimonas sp. PAMC28666]|uniref:phage tail assembly chaperone n=1 Tax=Glaciimonas sp. PAMC28666 TaxID=2807626 RepID=UPI001965F8D5|nr:phage tail assembly chaperone [Glaciimonas sp. PAMC28666]QRX82252.1 hypothetical protein JQN73_19500 [Glaciimonas sp. PAMC28666]